MFNDKLYQIELKKKSFPDLFYMFMVCFRLILFRSGSIFCCTECFRMNWFNTCQNGLKYIKTDVWFFTVWIIFPDMYVDVN